MSAVDQVPASDRRSPAARLGVARPLVGLALIAALLPLRANWGADLVLVGLAFTVPGVLLLRALRIPDERVGAFPVYVPAASLAVMLAAGLACDLLGPHLGVARPLHGVFTALAVIALSLALWVIGLRAPDRARLAWSGLLDSPADLLLLVLPALSALGALVLSNGHSGVIARVSVFLDVAVFVLAMLLAPRLGTRRLALTLFALALATAWSWSLRGQAIIGFDISTEYYIAQHTQAVGLWHTLHRNDAYGAMLSIGVLPSVLRALCGLSPLIAFKALYPAFAALLPVAIFLIGERLLTRRFALLAAALLLVQNYFFQQLPELARQEVALVFFAALLAALLEREMRRGTQVALAVTMALGLVVSHYSSTYLAIPLIVVALVVRTLIARWRGLPLLAPALLCAAIALAGGAAIWYGAVTHSASNVSSFTSTVRSHGLDLLPSDGGALKTFLNGNNVRSVSAPELERQAVRLYRRSAPYVQPLPQASQSRFALRSAAAPSPPVRVPILNTAVGTVLLPIYNELMLLLIAVGTLVMLLRRRTGAFLAELGALAFGGFAFLLFVRFSGTAASEYNQTRALLQSLILLALPAAWLLERLAGRIPRRPRQLAWVGVSLLVGLILAQQVGAFNAVIGGGTSLNLSASGEDYERFYETPAELSGARWAQTAAAHTILYADRYGQLRLFAVSGRAVLTEVMPRTLDRYSWVYASRTNTQLGRARAEAGSDFGTYVWPRRFLDQYFDVVYDNGDSEVFHG